MSQNRVHHVISPEEGKPYPRTMAQMSRLKGVLLT